MADKDKFYVTTAIDYASGNPHIGHAYEKVSADAIARWNRNIGKQVFFLTGTDEHGQKIVDTATSQGKEVKAFVDEKSQKFKELCKKLNITNDYFVRTTDEDHKRFVQKALQKSYDNGDIYLGKYSGLYCVGCERYYTEAELLEGDICPTHKKRCNSVEEESYFFKLSKYEKKLIELYEKNPDFISPKTKAQEVMNRVKEGLEDISISRVNLKWGIPLPFDDDHVTYVWFDALFNYLSAASNTKHDDFWPCDLHIIGHDIMWFHTVYWPAFLLSSGYELPKKVFSHGMILDGNGHKMSKSLGNIIDPHEVIGKYGVDEFRFFVMASGAYGEDLNFSYDLLIERINNDLNNDLGNLISRIHTMVSKYFEGKVPEPGNLTDMDKELIKNLDMYGEFNTEMQGLRFNKAIDLLWSRIRAVNAYINMTEAWKEKDAKRLGTIINILISSARLFAEYLDCFMPSKAERIRKQLGFEKDTDFKFFHIKSGHTISEKDNIFEKIVPKKEDNKEEPKTEASGFEKLDLRVAKIIDIQKHPDADKLYIEKVDVGNGEVRQILSGLADHYKSEELLGKKIILLFNLEKATIRGKLSEGMLLAADSDKGVGILLAPEGSKIGEKVNLGKEYNPPEKITYKEFSKVKIESTDKGLMHKEQLLVVNGKPLGVDKGIIGKVR